MSNSTNRLNAVLSDGYQFRLGDYISKGFNIFGKNAGMFIGYLLVSMVISICLSIIPILGQLASLFLSAALTAGYYIVAHKTERGEYPQFSNFFDGFNDWVPLFLSTLIGIACVLGCMIPMIIFLVAKLGFDGLVNNATPDFSGADIGVFILMFILIFVILFLAFSVVYTSLFIVFDKMDAWQAMKTSYAIVTQHFFSHLLFFFVWSIITILSALPIGLGLLFTIPAFHCSVYAAWADITNYNDEPDTNNDELLRHLIS
jgi:hypothetical protein